MSNCNPFKISLKSLYSYDDLTDLPSINGVEVRGDLSLEDLGLDTWLAENTKDFITQNELDESGFITETELDEKGFVTESDLEQHLSGFIANNNTGIINQYGFTIEDAYAPNFATFNASQVSLDYMDDISNSNSSVYISPGGISATAFFNGFSDSIYIDPYSGITLQSGDEYTTLDAYTLQALIALLG